MRFNFNKSFPQAFIIANLIREYMEVLQLPLEIHKRDSLIGQQMHQAQLQQQQQQPLNGTINRKSRPSSALHRGAPVIHLQAS